MRARKLRRRISRGLSATSVMPPTPSSEPGHRAAPWAGGCRRAACRSCCRGRARSSASPRGPAGRAAATGSRSDRSAAASTPPTSRIVSSAEVGGHRIGVIGAHSRSRTTSSSIAQASAPRSVLVAMVIALVTAQVIKTSHRATISTHAPRPFRNVDFCCVYPGLSIGLEEFATRSRRGPRSTLRGARSAGPVRRGSRAQPLEEPVDAGDTDSARRSRERWDGTAGGAAA